MAGGFTLFQRWVIPWVGELALVSERNMSCTEMLVNRHGRSRASCMIFWLDKHGICVGIHYMRKRGDFGCKYMLGGDNHERWTLDVWDKVFTLYVQICRNTTLLFLWTCGLLSIVLTSMGLRADVGFHMTWR